MEKVINMDFPRGFDSIKGGKMNDGRVLVNNNFNNNEMVELSGGIKAYKADLSNMGIYSGVYAREDITYIFTNSMLSNEETKAIRDRHLEHINNERSDN